MKDQKKKIRCLEYVNLGIKNVINLRKKKALHQRPRHLNKMEVLVRERPKKNQNQNQNQTKKQEEKIRARPSRHE